MNTGRKIFLVGAVAAIGAGICVAQYRRGAGRSGFRSADYEESGSYVWTEGSGLVNEDTVRTARETMSHSTGTPNWTNAAGFEKDVFTFARVIFKSDLRPRSRGDGRWRWLGWWVDYPDADLNLSHRLQQMTSFKTDPDCRVLKLTDPSISDYPLLYMEHAGYMRLRDEEVDALRKYLLNGGVLFMNDFWGAQEWNGFEAQMKRVLPGRSWSDLPMGHPLFHCVCDLKGPLNNLQVPTKQFWNRDYDPRDPGSSLQRVFRGEGSEEMHVRAWFDDKQRLMIIAIHNSDISDGWEREGEDLEYFEKFSEKISYPLGINIIYYVMTH
ncbi:MAG: DUF4159 domain-containing protein [Verrucomicrobia bacterium]|nr:DUF4159 domain-containing protein [Verrucomicrobiota bacterium]